MRAWAVMLSLALVGCQALPRYRWIDHDTALATMADRAGRLRTISGPCELALTIEDNGTVHLEAAVAARLPDHLRLRAWKLGQVAVDLLLTPQGVWLSTNREGEAPGGLEVLRDRFLEAWIVAGGALGRGGWVEDGGGPEFTFVRVENVGEAACVFRCAIRRSTLTPTRCTLSDASGQVRYELALDRYRTFGNLVWPTRISGRSGQYRFVLEMTAPELNEPVAPGAFDPPPGVAASP